MQKALEHLLWLSKVKRRNSSWYMLFLSGLSKLPFLLLGVLLCESPAAEQQADKLLLLLLLLLCREAPLCPLHSTSVWKEEKLANIRGSIYSMINLIAHKLHLPLESLTFLGVLQL